jgi:hypothetical protein
MPRLPVAAPAAQAPQAEAKSLLRACLECGRQVRGKPRCADCRAVYDRAKRQRCPDLDDAAERERRRLGAHHRATLGDWCPGAPGYSAHPSAT